jgi:hypothetical protein
MTNFMIDYYSYHIGQEVGTFLFTYLPTYLPIVHTIQTPLSSTLLQKWRVKGLRVGSPQPSNIICLY